MRIAGGSLDVARVVIAAANDNQFLAATGNEKFLVEQEAHVAAANILSVKPLLTFHDGDIVRAGLVRSVSKGADRIYSFVTGKANITEMIIIHSAVPDQADRLKKRLAWLFPEELIQIMELGAGLGVHGGPGVLLVALRQA